MQKNSDFTIATTTFKKTKQNTKNKKMSNSAPSLGC